MSGMGNPWDVPEWHSIRREAILVRHLVGSGATALGRASYADGMGEYYTAFFGLSVGLERLAKLILVADHAIQNGGQMPAEKVIRQHGHNIANLMDVSESIALKHSLKLTYARPVEPVSGKIIECIDAFADARRGRYANFAALGDPNLRKDEPIRLWWGEVAELILKAHYRDKLIQKRVEGRADEISALMSPVSAVLYFDEAGDAMQDVRTASIRTGQTRVVQRYGRFYALTVVRWLAEVLSELSEAACYTFGMSAFFGVWEHFQTYRLDDDFLKTRKKWPLR